MKKYIKKYWIFVILSPMFMFGEVLGSLLQPKYMSRIVDEGVLGLSNGGTGNLDFIISAGIQMILIALLGGVSGALSGVFANLCSQNLGNDLRKELFRKIMSFSHEETDHFSTGSLITRTTNDITQVQRFIMQCVKGFAHTFFMFVGGIVFMLTLDITFGTVVFIALPLILLCIIFFLKNVNPKFSILQQRLDRVNMVVQEGISGARVVKAYVKEDYESHRFDKANEQLVEKQLDILLTLAKMTPLMNVVLNASIVTIIKVGAIEVSGGACTPGNVMAAITYVSQILNAVMRMAVTFQNVSRGVASVRRIDAVLKEPVKITDGAFEGETSVKGKVEFRNVSFQYPGSGNKNVLEQINLTVSPGETLGILGATGSGKSSLVNLIPRFYDACEGEILVDGVNVKNYKLKELRNKISIALQTSEIFSATIRKNIAIGNLNASDEEIREAAEIAQAMEFINNKEASFETTTTQKGHSLSGGQKQRLAISRAIVRKSEILILDDATSALDLRTEAAFYAALNRKYKNMTKIIIAQRIASLQMADRIIIIDQGRIVAEGTHESLLNSSPIYQDIYDSQLKNGGLKDA